MAFDIFILFGGTIYSFIYSSSYSYIYFPPPLSVWQIYSLSWRRRDSGVLIVSLGDAELSFSRS